MMPELYSILQTEPASLFSFLIHPWFAGSVFVLAGLLHFKFPKVYLRIMPSYIPRPEAMVFWSGVFECLLGLGLFFQLTRSFAGWGLIALLVAVFPANIEMFRKSWAKKGVTFYTLLTLLRLPLQFYLMYWVYLSSVAAD